MSSSLVLLKLFLKELDTDCSIRGVQERKKIQKVVYLAQRAGLDLGYRFSWYLMGPYSSPLAQEYYDLDEAVSKGTIDFESYELESQVKEKLISIKPLLEKPSTVELDDPDWLELLASLDYLIKVGQHDSEQAKNIIKEKKPNLFGCVDSALEKLSQHKLA